MSTRRHLTRVQRVRIFDRARGRCHICGLKIHIGQMWEAEHIVPIWLDGSDIPENMAPAHLDPCHREKTAGEAPIRAKTDAQRANHLGIKRSGKKLPAGRNSTISKKINGEVVARPPRYGKHNATMAGRRIGGEYGN